jgi:hypothetical protein
MLRYVLSSLLILGLVAFSVRADDQKDTKDNKKEPQKATIIKMDTNAGTITVKMKDKEGKDVEKTFKLTEDIRYFDSTGKAAVIDVFKSGNEVLVIEEEGKLKELRQDKTPAIKDKTPDKKDGN